MTRCTTPSGLTPGGSFTYEIPVANGTYRVELNFAEIYSGITGTGPARV